MPFWSQVSDKAAAERHSAGGDGRSRDDRHWGPRRRKPEGNRRCFVSLQRFTSVPISWRTGELFPPLYILPGPVRLLKSDLQNIYYINYVFYICLKSAGGARVGASNWFSTDPGFAAGSSHPIQQRGSGYAPAFPQKQLSGCTWGSQPGGGAVDQCQTGETVDKLKQSSASRLQSFW